jgi:hypothetical protein
VLAAIAPSNHAAIWVGRTYAANTLGAILGGVSTSLLGVPLLGTQGVQQLLLALCALATVLAARRLSWSTATLAAAGAVFAACGPKVAGIPWQLVAYGRQIAASDYGARPLFVAEGTNASVAVTETPNGARFSTSAAKLRRPASIRTCASNGCWAICPHCCIRHRNLS